MQLLGAGIKEDWIPFVERSGPTSGTLARVVPILSYGRDIVRLAQSKLPPTSFSLDGLKRALAIMEAQFANCLATEERPPITLRFSRSRLQENFCNTNALLVREFREDDDIDFERILNTLNNRSPPNATEISAEASGEGILSLFLRQTMSEYRQDTRSPGDKNFLRGFEANMLRIESDFFWAAYITGFFTENGNLIEAEEWRLETDLREKIDAGVVTIPDRIIKPLMGFMTYTLKGAFHLNAFVAQKLGQMGLDVIMVPANGKRKRIVDRLSRGLTAEKKRRFSFSKLNHSLGSITKETMENQVRILESHAVVTCPTRRSVELTRNLSPDVQTYLIGHCNFTPELVITLMHDSLELQD